MADINIICCIGAGYVGGPTMTVFASQCPEIMVNVAEIIPKRITRRNHDDFDQLRIYEPGLTELIGQKRGKNLFLTTEVKRAIEEANTTFVSRKTPTKTFGKGKVQLAGLKHTELSARSIAKVVNTDKIAVEKSILPVRSQTLKIILEKKGLSLKEEN